MNLIYTIFMFVFAIGTLVAVHEFGHFWVARRLGVKVLKFSIGFGPSLYSWHGRDGTEYALSAIPLGGYVKMLGEHAGDTIDPADQHRAFDRKPVSRRFAIVAAGPVFNLLFAILAYAVVFMIGVPGLAPIIGEVAPNSLAARAGVLPGERVLAVNDEPIKSWQDLRMSLVNQAMSREPAELLIERSGERRVHTLQFAGLDKDQLNASFVEEALGLQPYLPIVVGQLQPGSPAERAGLQKGDRIVKVNGQVINTWSTFLSQVEANPGKPLTFIIDRDGREQPVTITPAPQVVKDRTVGRIGMSPASLPDSLQVLDQSGPIEGLGRGFRETVKLTSMTFEMLWQMAKGLVSTENLGGPIAIAQFAGQSAQGGVVTFLSFLAMISISLGVLNLLPIPVLDGGHLFFYVVEMIKGSPVSEAVMARAQQAGLFLLLLLMGFAFYNDITRLLNQ
ncbi:RIP metalloprotease RseP [Thermithiobacillus plumbiphilus]|uniref:Zinc metalloprotease n=1 Tax=Thermithiobacillus plumbiphilus TaxID=1729899 RepID=A0ABU9D4H0_9PROT